MLINWASIFEVELSCSNFPASKPTFSVESLPIFVVSTASTDCFAPFSELSIVMFEIFVESSVGAISPAASSTGVTVTPPLIYNFKSLIVEPSIFALLITPPLTFIAVSTVFASTLTSRFSIEKPIAVLSNSDLSMISLT